MRRSVPNAPFKPPRLLSSGSSAASANNPSSTSTKEVSYVGVSRSNGPGARVASQPGSNPKRPKLTGISNTVLQSSASEKPLLMTLSSKYYVVQWRKYTNKKNKSWDGDGYIAVSSSGITLKGDTHGNGNHKLMGRTSNTSIDGLIKFGSYEAEVDYEITSKDELVSFQSTQPASSSSRTSSLSENDSIIPVSQTAARPYKKLQTSLTSRLSSSTSPALTESRKRAPLYETTSEDAFVLPPPPDSSNYVDVVVDPLISKHLRPHQREDSDSEELDVEDNPSGWISALDYKQVDEEPKRKKLSIRNALAEYQHFDPKSLNRARTIKTVVIRKSHEKRKAQ
ncbi:hypothetical protein QCA50_016235 [Cerrena zonata]|uniref:Uncharacterized protein n=1 Tax=Cerrena zonata TaxID=2478898 RepID=A0AAW0FTP2_9APHY